MTATPWPIQHDIRESMAFSAIVDINGVMNPKTGGFHVVQDAIDAKHKSIFVRDGTYPPFDIDYERVCVVGESWDTLISAPVGENAITINQGADGCIISNLEVRTPGGGGQTKSGIYIDDIFAIVENIRCQDSDLDAIYISVNAASCVVRGGMFTGCDRAGIGLQGANNKIIGAHCSSNAGDGVYAAANTSDNSTVTGCNFESNTGYGIDIGGGDENLVVVGNRMTNNTAGNYRDTSGTSTFVGNDTT